MLILALLVSTLSPGSGKAQDTSNTTHQEFPKATGWVNDFEDLFTKRQKQRMERAIAKFERETTIEIAVATLSNDFATADSFENYTLRLGNYWGVGKAGKNNGILIALSTRLRRIRIHNGYGIEEIITNEETKTIIEDYITPYYKKGKHYKGTYKGIISLMKLLRSKM